MKKLRGNRKPSNFDSSQKTSDGKPVFKDVLATAVLLFSLVGTFLAFIGYGVALGANIVFGVPHELLFQSPFELIELSVWAISHISLTIGKLSFHTLYLTYFFKAAFSALIIFIAWMLAYVLIKLPKKRAAIEKRTSLLRDKIMVAPSVKVPMKIAIIQALLGGVGFMLAAPLVIVVGVYLMLLGIFVMPAISLIGVQAAKTHFAEFVVGPERCQPVLSRDFRLHSNDDTEEKVATCLDIVADKTNHIRGREVLTTSSATLLFNPENGKVTRVPLRNATVETLGSLQ